MVKHDDQPFLYVKSVNTYICVSFTFITTTCKVSGSLKEKAAPNSWLKLLSDLENWPRLQHCPFPQQPHSTLSLLSTSPSEHTVCQSSLSNRLRLSLTSCSVPSCGGVSAPAPADSGSGRPSSGRLRSSLAGICSCCRPPSGPRCRTTATQQLELNSDPARSQPAFSDTRRKSTLLALILVAGDVSCCRGRDVAWSS